MTEQDFQSADEVLEYAARLIEETDISDLRGVWAKRKRGREDADLRTPYSERRLMPYRSNRLIAAPALVC